jgi:hypothetical protein
MYMKKMITSEKMRAFGEEDRCTAKRPTLWASDQVADGPETKSGRAYDRQPCLISPR